MLKALRERVIVLYECEFMRNYVHIHDVCRAFRYVLNNWSRCKNETYNVGNDAINMNKLQLAQKISEHMPLEIMKAEFLLSFIPHIETQLPYGYHNYKSSRNIDTVRGYGSSLST